MTTAHIMITDPAVNIHTGSESFELPRVELVRSSGHVDVYRSGVIGWSQFHGSIDPYNKIDTHINALIAIRHQMRLEARIKAQIEEQARNARVDEILLEAGFQTTVLSAPARRLAEKIVDLEQEVKR